MKLPGRKLPARSLTAAAAFLVFAAAVFALPGSLPAQAVAQSTRGAGQYVISGVVVNASTGQPLERAEVTLQPTGRGDVAAETMTGEDGRFVFEHLPAAKYELRASRRGFLSAAYDQHEEFSTAIVTGKGLIADGLIFRLEPEGVIGGTVTDDSGDPVQRAAVSLYRQQIDRGLDKIVRSGTTMTDDLGAYEFAGLEPGNYYIAVSGTPWYKIHLAPKRDAHGNVIAEAPHSPLDVAYPLTFFDGATDSDSATPIPLKAGQVAQANFALHAAPAVYFSVQIPVTDEGLVSAGPMLRQEAFGTSFADEPGMASIGVSDGQVTMEFGGVAPGHYEIGLRGPSGAASGMTSVDATGDMKIDPSQAMPLADVSGQIALADGERLPDRATVSLRSEERPNANGAAVAADGTFTLAGIAPGNYEVSVLAPGVVLTVMQMIASGATVEGHMLKVGSQPVSFAAILGEGSSTVTGYVTRDGKPAAGELVLLAPRNPAADREMFRRGQSDFDGSFVLKGVIPGEYTVMAIEDGWTLDWARPEVIAHYLAKGRNLTVSPHSRNVALDSAIEVQAK